MWADTKQLTILKWMTTHLEAIGGIDVQDRNAQKVPIRNPDGTPKLVQKSLLGRVYRGRSTFGQEETDPFLSILEGTKPDQQPEPVGYSGLNRHELWPLLVQGFQQDNADNPLDNLYRLKGAVEQRLARIIQTDERTDAPLYPNEYLMDGLIADMMIGPGVVYPSNPTTGGTEAFYLPVMLRYDINLADPYSVT